MRVKLDENMSNSHAEFLRSLTYDCDRVTDEGLSGAENRFLITLDLDFSDIRSFPPGTHPGILLLRPKTRSRQGVFDVLSRVIREHPLESLQGCLETYQLLHGISYL